MFAVDSNPRFSQGEILLLQLVRQDAISIGKLHSRVEFALIYDHYEVDHTGEISRRHWPSAGKTWKYILFCSNATGPWGQIFILDFPIVVSSIKKLENDICSIIKITISGKEKGTIPLSLL
jgi:hypothetical protein